VQGQVQWGIGEPFEEIFVKWALKQNPLIMEQSFKSLGAYKKAFSLAMDVFEISKSFPRDEKYSLTDQIRRCSRSVAACIAEAYRKKRYESYFVSKASDADMENSETRVWLDFSLACKYIDEERYQTLDDQAIEIGKLLNHMIVHPERYCK
jgi:four helix bundle protein